MAKTLYLVKNGSDKFGILLSGFEKHIKDTDYGRSARSYMGMSGGLSSGSSASMGHLRPGLFRRWTWWSIRHIFRETEAGRVPVRRRRPLTGH
ncbi:MAG: hypothetical protein ACYCX4_14955 [Bacillota bacterium]